MDLRFGESRLVVRPITGAYLLLLCTAQANLQFLNISVNVAVPKIARLVESAAAQVAKPAPQVAPPPVAPPAASPETEPSKGEMTGFEKVFLKMDTWMRKQSGE